MRGLDKLTGKIIDDANFASLKMINEANAKADEIFAAAEAEKEKIHTEIFNSAMAQAESIKNLARSQAESSYKNVIMNKRNEIFESVFTAAENEILSLSDEKYVNFIVSLLIKVLSEQLEVEHDSLRLYGEDITAVSYTIVMNKKDRDRVGKTVIAALRRATVGKLSADVISKVEMSSKAANIRGGFILDMGSIQINASIEAILAEKKREMEAEIIGMLFPEE